MFKNAMIALLAAILLSGAECYADHRAVMIYCIWVMALIVICYIEDLYERIHAQQIRRRKLQRKIKKVMKGESR